MLDRQPLAGDGATDDGVGEGDDDDGGAGEFKTHYWSSSAYSTIIAIGADHDRDTVGVGAPLGDQLVHLRQ
jgi:hypothetical protein